MCELLQMHRMHASSISETVAFGDLGDVVVHIFHREDREFYQIERLWGDAPLVNMTLETVEAMDKRGGLT